MVDAMPFPHDPIAIIVDRRRQQPSSIDPTPSIVHLPVVPSATVINAASSVFPFFSESPSIEQRAVVSALRLSEIGVGVRLPPAESCVLILLTANEGHPAASWRSPYAAQRSCTRPPIARRNGFDDDNVNPFHGDCSSLQPIQFQLPLTHVLSIGVPIQSDQLPLLKYIWDPALHGSFVCQN